MEAVAHDERDRPEDQGETDKPSGSQWRSVRYRTVKEVLTPPDRLPRSQLIEIGQVPRVVLLPTFHDQDTIPVELAVLSPSPTAVDGPDL